MWHFCRMSPWVLDYLNSLPHPTVSLNRPQELDMMIIRRGLSHVDEVTRCGWHRVKSSCSFSVMKFLQVMHTFFVCLKDSCHIFMDTQRYLKNPVVTDLLLMFFSHRKAKVFNIISNNS